MNTQQHLPEHSQQQDQHETQESTSVEAAGLVRFGSRLRARMMTGWQHLMVIGKVAGFLSARRLNPLSGQSWGRVIVQSTAFWLVTRLAFLIFTYFYITILKQEPVNGSTLLAPWYRWDVPWYLQASQGYVTPESTAFFPLYPLLIAFMTAILGSAHRLVAALVIANLGTLGACIGIGCFAAQEQGHESASWRMILITLAYPMAIFLTAPYNEGLYLAFAAFTVFFMRRGNWKLAALMAFLAGLTRITSVILILPLLWEYGRQHHWWDIAAMRAGTWRQRFTGHTLSEWLMIGSAVPLAIVIFMLFLWWRYGSPLIFLTVERTRWHHVLWFLWHTLGVMISRVFQPHLDSSDRALQIITIGSLLIFGTLTLALISRMPVSFTLYMLGLFCLIFSAVDPGLPYVLPSAGRYLLEALPIFLALSRWSKDRPWLETLLVSGGFLLQGLFAMAFFSGRWIE